MIGVKKLVLFAAAASALVIRRDVTTILNDLTAIDTDTNNLKTAVSNWDGSFFGALPISSAENSLDSSVKSATSDAQAQTNFSSADSASIVNYLANTIAPDAQAALTELDSRKADADSAGITSVVESGLKTLKSDIDALGAALVAVMSSDQSSNATAAITTIDGYFTTAINTFA